MLTLYLPIFCKLFSSTLASRRIMKNFLIFSGMCGLILLLAVAIMLFKGVPANQRDVVKGVAIKRS